MIEIQEDNIELVKILNNEAVVGNNQKKVQELIEYKLQIIKRNCCKIEYLFSILQQLFTFESIE